MSNNHNLPPIRGNPIPQAPLNHDPSHGRPGPIIQLPIPKNRDGKPDYNKAPGLDLSRIVPVGSLNTNPPPTEGLEGTPSFSGTNEKKNKSIASQKRAQNNNNNQNQDGKDEEEEDDDDEDDDDKSDFSIIEHPIMTPTSESDAQAATDLLSEKVPPELISEILDRAEYFPHEIIGSQTEYLSVFDGDKIYLTAHIPDFKALEKDTAGKGGKEGAGGRRGRVRKLVFRFKSYDQGWSSYGSFYGSFKGCWSWLDVEVWRKREVNEEKQEGDDEKGMYRVCESLLQRNKHAESDETEYEIVWRWDEDKLGEDHADKWEDGVVDENGEIRDAAAWEKGGRHERNGEFVRQLKGGDEIRVIIKARFPGWRCTIERCEVECWWAV
ncbi:hypothetical protein TWF106_004474 [Orbilia oligospora]|uniref:Uncharacterized protein n=1 Tax=Orbilia oligospora TaxID=2813651 RepID=A0A7C8U6T4_ORBOL|nr:hypothetical protein TWF106_004474 [Orbilia oligospora]